MKPTASSMLSYDLPNTNRVVFDSRTQARIRRLQELEKDRIFCKHDVEHFYATARICRLLVLENQLEVAPDLIYTTAFLHDLGRVEEMEEGIPHDQASRAFAQEVLEVTDFSAGDKGLILEAIAGHRQLAPGQETFASLFAQADKLSRPCWNCPAQDQCYWSYEKKNLMIKI